MAHPYDHARSSVKKWGGEIGDYLPIHEWFDETKGWLGDSRHRLFRHHSEGIFQCEEIFGIYIINSAGKKVLVRYIPSAKEWITNLDKPPLWMLKTQKIND
jgi:hypothetical protein